MLRHEGELLAGEFETVKLDFQQNCGIIYLEIQNCGVNFYCILSTIINLKISNLEITCSPTK